MRSELAKANGRAKSPKSRPCTNDSRGCEIAELFRVLGKTYMLDILHMFLVNNNGPRRFVELQDRLEISPNTLSDRLKELVAAGLLTRTPIPNKIPPWVDYEATEKAKDLHTVFDSLIEWAGRHDLRAVPAAEKVEKEEKAEA
jgi:DNA-binding HxlR family transcriptional regulator